MSELHTARSTHSATAITATNVATSDCQSCQKKWERKESNNAENWASSRRRLNKYFAENSDNSERQTHTHYCWAIFGLVRRPDNAHCPLAAASFLLLCHAQLATVRPRMSDLCARWHTLRMIDIITRCCHTLPRPLLGLLPPSLVGLFSCLMPRSICLDID